MASLSNCVTSALSNLPVSALEALNTAVSALLAAETANIMALQSYLLDINIENLAAASINTAANLALKQVPQSAKNAFNLFSQASKLACVDLSNILKTISTDITSPIQTYVQNINLDSSMNTGLSAIVQGEITAANDIKSLLTDFQQAVQSVLAKASSNLPTNIV